MEIPHDSSGFATDVRPWLQWKLIGFALLVLVALVISELYSRGIDQDSLRLMLRTTARTSAFLFALGFATPFWSRLQSYSDSLLVSFAASQTLHLIAIIWLVTIRHTEGKLIDPPGLLAYTCVAVIIFRVLSERSGGVSQGLKRLEKIALYVFWLIITGAFAGLFPGIKFNGLHFLIVLLLVISLVVRLYSGAKMGRSLQPLAVKAQP